MVLKVTVMVFQNASADLDVFAKDACDGVRACRAVLRQLGEAAARVANAVLGAAQGLQRLAHLLIVRCRQSSRAGNRRWMMRRERVRWHG